MSDLNTSLLVVGATVLVLGMTSTLVKSRWAVSESLLALAVGVILGPMVAGVLSLPDESRSLLHQASRLTLAVALLATALRLPRGFVRRRLRSIAILLAVAMPIMWLVSSGIGLAVLDVPWWLALVLGGILTPTDPVVASSIVTGTAATRHLPASLRNILSCEAGANDALAHPLIFLPLLLLEHSTLEGLRHWAWEEILISTLGGALLGLVIGWGTGRVILWINEQWGTENPSHFTVTLAMMITLVGASGLIGVNGLLSVFVAGLVFKEVAKDEEELRAEHVPGAVERFFLLPVFVFLGAAIPWDGWAQLGWRGVAFAVAILLLRRLPLMLLLHRVVPSIDGHRQARFAGWFGPIGVAALFYATQISERLSNPHVFHVASFVIVGSVVAHGLTATPLVQRFGRKEGAPGSEGHSADDDLVDAQPSVT